MNIRKPTDYTAMFAALDALMAAQLPQMELYCEIGRVLSGRGEKGAAVAASEYLQAAYPAADGFSPQCAPDAGLLPDVRRYAGVAGSGNASELDTKCGHHGGRIDHGREVLVHSEGRRKRFIQNGAASDDRILRAFGNCSWRKRGYLLYCRK